jgi:histidine triad (HIT) family protein
MTVVDGCLFCGIVAETIPADIVYRNDSVVAFRDINPQAPTHVLVVPRRHIDDAGTVEAGDAEVLAAMVLAAQSVAEVEGIGDEGRGYRLIMNVGLDALNSVPHLHLHVVGGRSLTWPPG